MLVQGEASGGRMWFKCGNGEQPKSVTTWMNANSGMWQQVQLFWLKEVGIYEVGMDSN
jgi:hypothetical protein